MEVLIAGGQKLATEQLMKSGRAFLANLTGESVADI